MPGIRAIVSVEDPDGCPVVSAFGDNEVTDARWAVEEDGTPVGEVSLRDGDDTEVPEGFSPVFETDDGGGVYRFDRGDGCVCGAIEGSGVPVTDVRFRNGSLDVVLHLDDVDSLRGVLDRVSDVVPDGDVSVKSLVRSDSIEGVGSDPRVVDIGCLTDRQQEVMRKAYSMGYFEHPRESTGEEVAEELGVSVSTFSEHLSSVERKLFGELVS